MYTTFYGLNELPFELSPNPKYLLLTPRHREALANLQYGISASKSLTLLIGAAGTGKTTLVHAALVSHQCRGARIVHLANPMLTRDEFIEFLARAFQLSSEAMHSKAALLAELERELLARRDQGVTTALVIDEAQSLSVGLLEEVRLLSNIETPGQKLLPLVLAGQPELAVRLNLPSFVQLKQRVALRCTLGLLDAAETAAYVTGRLTIAGANGRQIFTREALSAIHQRSGGVPRTIHVICDNALVSGFASGATSIGPEVIRDVCDDFDLGYAGAAPPEAVQQAPAGTEVRNPPAAVDSAATKAVTERPPNRSFANVGKRRRFSFF
jgi:general secretion pathway protein A